MCNKKATLKAKPTSRQMRACTPPPPSLMLIPLAMALITLKNEKNEVTVSGICPREDNLFNKANSVNENLGKRCHRQKLGFIEHDQLNAKKHTNSSKLHLNKAGNSILQRKFLKEIKCDYVTLIQVS